MTVQDSNEVLKIFQDKNTVTQNTAENPGKVFLKASLFDIVSPVSSELFTEKRLPLHNGK
ncbi:hypothetical protein N7462_000707 [Penicillium macrosclerotiorum]|uniref:uncharacterized protein n=1 Tax=Penicillium macrosclerotiorum TaxID=303699 RepID=UPI002546A59C|nr:uncharacterized protein N7462_000707 [Penicillium macrosclerotiorum]KAJ5698702.1 hypothetical protein N7462_000707 [Penicillium macrosclerotiorum]